MVGWDALEGGEGGGGVEVGADVVGGGEGVAGDDAHFYAGEVMLFTEACQPGVLISQAVGLADGCGGCVDLGVGKEVGDGIVVGGEDEVRGMGVGVGEGLFDGAHGTDLDGQGAAVRVDEVDGLDGDALFEDELEEAEGGVPAGGPEELVR